MESDTCPLTVDNDCLYHIPQCIQQAYHPGVGFPLGMSTNIFHPRSVRISPCCHIYCVGITIFCHRSGFGGVDVTSARYASCSHFLKCSARRWVGPPALFRRSHLYLHLRLQRDVIVDPKGVTWIGTVLRGVIMSSRHYSSV